MTQAHHGAVMLPDAVLGSSKLSYANLSAERGRKDHGPESYSVRLCRNTSSYIVEPGRERCYQHPAPVSGLGRRPIEATGLLWSWAVTWLNLVICAVSICSQLLWG